MGQLVTLCAKEEPRVLGKDAKRHPFHSHWGPPETTKDPQGRPSEPQAACIMTMKHDN